MNDDSDGATKAGRAMTVVVNMMICCHYVDFVKGQGLSDFVKILFIIMLMAMVITKRANIRSFSLINGEKNTDIKTGKRGEKVRRRYIDLGASYNDEKK